MGHGGARACHTDWNHFQPPSWEGFRNRNVIKSSSFQSLDTLTRSILSLLPNVGDFYLFLLSPLQECFASLKFRLA